MAECDDRCAHTDAPQVAAATAGPRLAAAYSMTKLDKPLRRELSIDRTAYVLTIEPDRFRLVLKGHRKGLEFAWRDLVSGEAALAVALNASLQQQNFVRPPEPTRGTRARKDRSRGSRKLNR